MSKNYVKSFLIGLFVASFLAFAVVASATVWHVPGDFATIQDAIDDVSVVQGDTILVDPGYHKGASVTKSVEIKGIGGAIINDGPLHSHPAIDNQGFRLEAGSDGTTISHLRFDGVDLAIMNGAAVDNISVSQCTFINSVQAISNWSGSGWNIDHNEIIDLRTICGGGIGILIADRTGNVVTDNVVAHNKISGTLHVSEGDCGGYSGTGIVLYADFRYASNPSYPGSDEIAYNRVVKNKISLVSDTPEVVDVVAFELTDTRDLVGTLCDEAVVHSNLIGFNDFRGTEWQISLTPEDLDLCNKISRNLGDNRGRGLHPKGFFK